MPTVTPQDERIVSFLTYLTAIEDGKTVKQAMAASGLQWSTLQRWLADDRNTVTNERGEAETFASRLARARTQQALAYADRGQEELEAATPEDWQVRKARAQYFQWRAAMADPKGYGDRKQVEITGGVQVQHLDALRAPRVTAKATIANPMPANEMARLASPAVEDATTSVEEGSGSIRGE